MDRSWPVLGCGVGLRSAHYPEILEKRPRIDWFEAVTENYMDTGGRPVRVLEEIRRRYPVALHGTALSIGSTDPLDAGYLKRLKQLTARIDPFVVSDHLCWSGVGGEALHDLLPLPFTEEAVRHVVARIAHVQEFLGRRILVENVSTYVTYRASEMPEWTFLSEVTRRSGCGILLDLNNVHVNARNHGFDPLEYAAAVPWSEVGQIHLAGHADMGKYLFDTHGAPVTDEVWDLYARCMERWGRVSTLIEWDENIPDLARLSAEADKARRIYERAAPPSPGAAPRRPPAAEAIAGAPDPAALADVQRRFKRRMTCGDAPAGNLAGLLNPQGGEPGESRMSVYAVGYAARIHEALSEVYESVHGALGDEAFCALCRNYARARRPSHYNLNEAGRELPGYLAALPVLEDLPFLADLARFEWSVWEAFHAFDGAPADPSSFAGIPMESWEKARIRFQPSVRLFRAPWAVLRTWLTRENPAQDSAPARREEKVLIARKGDQVRCEIVGEAQFRLIEGLLSGRTLEDACAALAGYPGEDAGVDEWFGAWMRDGLIAGVSFEEAAAKPV